MAMIFEELWGVLWEGNTMLWLPASGLEALAVLLRKLRPWRRSYITTVNSGCLTPTRMCAVINPLRSLYQLDTQPRTRRWGCHFLELQDQPLAFCGRGGIGSIRWIGPPTCTWSVFGCVGPRRNYNQHWKGCGDMSLQKYKAMYAPSERKYTGTGAESWISLGWYSRGRRKLTHELAKQTQFCLIFISPWSQHRRLQTMQSCLFLNRYLFRLSHLWSWTLSNVWKNTVLSTSSRYGFLRWVRFVRNCEFRKALYVEDLFRIERIQLRWFSHMSKLWNAICNKLFCFIFIKGEIENFTRKLKLRKSAFFYYRISFRVKTLLVVSPSSFCKKHLSALWAQTQSMVAKTYFLPFR